MDGAPSERCSGIAVIAFVGVNPSTWVIESRDLGPDEEARADTLAREERERGATVVVARRWSSTCGSSALHQWRVGNQVIIECEEVLLRQAAVHADPTSR